MFGSKSNIFVSICPSYDYALGDDKRYMTPHHVWMLTAETPKHSLPGTHRRGPNPRHYSIVWSEDEDQYTLQQVAPTNLGIIGSILIQRNAPISPEKAFDQFLTGLEAYSKTLETELDGSEGSEHWMRFALQALQQNKIVQPFDVEMFMTFSQAYLARRMDGNGPARIAYSRLHKDHSQKEKKGFWISYPQVTSNYDGNRVYGGLM